VAVFDADRAVERAAAGHPTILVRRETNPDDLNGMIASEASSRAAAERHLTPQSSRAAWASPVSAVPTPSRWIFPDVGSPSARP
jgi:hypothetical protein